MFKGRPKRLLAVLFCGLLAAVPPLPALAAGDQCGVQGPVTAQIEWAEEENAADYAGGAVESPLYRSPANAAIDGSMYSCLSTRQKACYKALEGISIQSITRAPVQNGFYTVECGITGITNAAVNGRISGGNFYAADAAAQAAYDAINNDLSAAVVALRYDRPDLLWLDGSVTYGIYLSWYPGTSQVTVTTPYYGFPLIYGGQEESMRTRMMREAQAVADAAKAQPDTYSKLKAAHDQLALRSTYNHVTTTQLEEDLSHSAYSALVGGDAYEPVCDGYSKAMKLVCGLLDIPCLLVSSPTHMWNNVKMDDGLWYNLDLTWDDGQNKPGEDAYFLVGSETPFSGNTFSQQPAHQEQNPFTDAGVKVSGTPYPSKNKTAYQYLGEEYPPLRFPDVTRADWFYETVETAAELGYFKGDENGNFHPRKNITRAEFATVMANMAGGDLDSYQSWADYEDIKGRPWYSKAVAWASESGLMQGDGSRFRPMAPITKQEICVVLYNSVLNQSGTDAIDTMFEDDENIAGWAWKAVYACQGLDLVRGDNNGNFNPQKGATRCEAATILSRLSQLDEE